MIGSIKAFLEKTCFMLYAFCILWLLLYLYFELLVRLQEVQRAIVLVLNFKFDA